MHTGDAVSRPILGRGGDDAGDAVLLRSGRGAEHPFEHAREGPEGRGWEDDEDGEQPPEARRVCARGWRFWARRVRSSCGALRRRQKFKLSAKRAR